LRSRTPVVIVAGLWQDLRLDGVGDSDPLVVTLHYGYSIPANGSDSNLYTFSYRAGVFNDDLYGKWLDISNCSMSGGSCIMRISVNVTARENPWTIEVNGTGNLTYSTQISVEAPNPDFGLSSPDFLLRVDPNTPGKYNPEGAQYFRTSNDGNVPMVLSLTYSALGDRLSATNVTRLAPGSQIYHYLTIDAPAWMPSETKVTGTVHAAPLLPAAKEMLSLSQAYSLSFTAYVRVGRGGMQLEDAGVFVLQHPQSLKGKLKQTISFDAYLSGETDVEMRISGEGASIVSVNRSGSPQSMPFKANLSGSGEVPFNITVKPTKDGTTVRVAFDIKTTDGKVSRTYYTDISVPLEPIPPAKDPEPNTLVPAIFLTIALIAAGAWIAYAVIKQKPEPEPDEDNKKKTARSRRRRPKK